MILCRLSLAFAADVIVDDADPGFLLIGSASEDPEGGYGGHFWFRPATGTPTTWAQWAPPVAETRLYTVQGFVPLSPNATSVTAPVTIHAHGEIVTGSYDQSVIGGDFHEVFGGRAFKLVVGGDAYVEMNDASGESSDLFVGFDAFRFTDTGPPGAAGIGDACASTPECSGALLCDASLCRAPCTESGCGPGGACEPATGLCDVWPVEGTDSGTPSTEPDTGTDTDTGTEPGSDDWPDESVVVPARPAKGCATAGGAGLGAGGWVLLLAALRRRRAQFTWV